MQTILISGFKAFHTHSYNVTELLVRRLESQPQKVRHSDRRLPVVRWDIRTDSIFGHHNAQTRRHHCPWSISSLIISLLERPGPQLRPF